MTTKDSPRTIKSTTYYRRNKETKETKHACDKCDYVTYYSKGVLHNHINAKHTLEKDRPYQCKEEGCDKGFSQKAHLIKHLENKHSKIVKSKKHILYYNIMITDIQPCSQKIRKRIEFYKNNKILSSESLYNNEYTYKDDVVGGKCDNSNTRVITLPLLKYDNKKNYITFEVSKIECDREENRRGRYGYG